MCSRGVYQLSKLSLYFCDYGGSSSGVRSLLLSSTWKQFVSQNEHLNLNIICKRNAHPYIAGAYLNGYTKSVPLRSDSEEVIMEKITKLKNSLGRQSFEASGKRVYGATKSIQGLWQPNLFNKYPVAELETVHQIPYVKIDTQQVEVDNQRSIRLEKDQSNQLLSRRRIRDGNFVHNKGKQL